VIFIRPTWKGKDHPWFPLPARLAQGPCVIEVCSLFAVDYGVGAQGPCILEVCCVDPNLCGRLAVLRMGVLRCVFNRSCPLFAARCAMQHRLAKLLAELAWMR
jgi:hypothetical protein